MKRLNRGAIAAMAVALSTSASPTSTAPMTQNVAIRLANSSSGVCILITPKIASHPDFHIVAVRGDTVNWNIRNDCTRTVVVGLSSFTAPGLTVEHPLVQAANTLSSGSISQNTTGVITATVKSVINHFGRTRTVYVYTIEEIQTPPNPRVAFADPQIEIP
jgi:hypothetical protein